MKTSVKVALVQSSPVQFDLGKSIEKVKDQVNGLTESVDLILFPEAYIPGYPRGFSFGSPVGSRTDEGRELWKIYWDNSLSIPGPAIDKLGKIAESAGAFLAIGVVEKESITNGSLYCTLLYFDPAGNLVGKHRKIKPTAAERIIWAEGNGSSLTTLQTDVGVVGGLICWENYMPMARMAMYEKGVEIYLAPTADDRDSWQATMKHIACEGRCFVLGCNQYVVKDSYPKDLPAYHELDHAPEIMSRGGSVVIDPFGNIIAGPLFDEEGVLIAELDMHQIIKARMDFDPVGHYNRPDIFKYKARQQPETVIIGELPE